MKYLRNTKYIVFLVIGILVIFLVYRIQGSRSNEVKGETNGRVEVKDARSSKDVNFNFSFPLKDSNKETVSEVKVTIESAELRDEIIVKGKKATSVKGRTFLVLNIKVKNEYDQAIEVNTRNYIRLSVNGNEDEWLAPDIHNDPLEVQAISTKMTRMGFPVNESDKDFVLQIGEITGDKQKVELDL